MSGSRREAAGPGHPVEYTSVPGAYGGGCNTSQVVTRSRSCSHSNHSGMHHQQQLRSPPQRALISTALRAAEGKNLVVGIGCSSTAQPLQFDDPVKVVVESILNSENHEVKVRDIFELPHAAPHQKPNVVSNAWSRCKTSHDAAAAKRSRDLEDVRSDNVALNAKCQKLLDGKQVAERYAGALQRHLVRLRNDYEARLEAAKYESHELSHRQHEDNQKSSADCLEEVIKQKRDNAQSLNAPIQSSNASVEQLQKVSQEHESSQKSKPAQADANELKNVSCGAYGDGCASTAHLNSVMSTTKTRITRFQRKFMEAIKSRLDPASVRNLLCPDVVFERPHHVVFAVKAAIYDVFFQDFENESFNTFFGGCRGVSPFLDPHVRITKFFEYYMRKREGQNSREEMEDPQFEEFCEMKASFLWEKLNLGFDQSTNKKGTKVTCLEELGGPQLTSSLRAAAISVWLLHKLTFSFEPPASLFRVARGVNLHPDYMTMVVCPEDIQRVVPVVGFMISPGLRLQKTVLQSEVYLVVQPHGVSIE